MANDDNNDNSLDDVGMTNTDRAFLVFLFGVLILTGWLGYEAYLEGHRTETTKESGETWGKWLTTAGAERFNKDYAISACTPTDANSNAPHVWGDCLKAITTKPAELSNLINPFTLEPIAIVAACDKEEHTTTGQMILEKALPTPPGSAVPFDVTALTDSDVIDKKLQIHITICDGGDYPIKIAEVEF